MVRSLSFAGTLASVPATIVNAADISGRCNLAPDCRETVSCPDMPLQLEWTDESNLSIDGQRVEIVRIVGTRELDKIDLGDTEWTVKAEGPAILVSARELAGSIRPHETDGHVIARFRDTSKKRYSDYLASWRVYSGPCEELF